MSDILIKGMEMPINDDMNPTAVWVYPNGYAIVFKDNGNMKQYTKAVPVPPHGDLIDRNEMFVEFVIEGQKSTRYKVGEKWELNGEEVRRVIQRLPSVIPAEEPKEEKEDKELLVEKIRKLQTYKLAPELEKLVSLEKVIAILEGEENVF